MPVNTSTTIIAASAPTGTTEGVAVTSPLVTTGLASGQGIAVWGSLNILTGASGTLITIKCRQGAAITGTQVGDTKTVTTVAATHNEIPFSFFDASPVASSQYSITVTENAGTWTATFGVIFTSTVTGQG